MSLFSLTRPRRPSSRVTGVVVALLGWCVVSSDAAAAKTPTFEEVVKSIKATVEPATAKRGETVTWRLVVELIDGWHTYPTVQPDPGAEGFVTGLSFSPPA